MSDVDRALAELEGPAALELAETPARLAAGSGPARAVDSAPGRAATAQPSVPQTSAHVVRRKAEFPPVHPTLRHVLESELGGDSELDVPTFIRRHGPTG